MPSSHPKPILNASLPAQFRQIRIELAREPGHPDGDASVAYVIIAPLDAHDKIDAALWRAHREACRITRIRPNEDDEHGLLVHRQGGGWILRYESNKPDATGFHFKDERFVSGEYVSISDTGKMQTYRVAAVSHL
jgi:hypothetical protein